jgi:hypothetical protein
MGFAAKLEQNAVAGVTLFPECDYGTSRLNNKLYSWSDGNTSKE